MAWSETENWTGPYNSKQHVGRLIWIKVPKPTHPQKLFRDKDKQRKEYQWEADLARGDTCHGHHAQHVADGTITNLKKDCSNKRSPCNWNHHCRLCGRVYPGSCVFSAAFADGSPLTVDKECYDTLLEFQKYPDWENEWNHYVTLKREGMTPMPVKE